MPKFTVTGDVDPFLHVSMRHGETIYCESDAMVMMESTLDLKGKMKGGLGAALMRTFANGESFFQQHIEAARGDGDCLLSPTLPGAMQIVDCGPGSQYIISDGAFVAASSGVDLKVRTQSLGNALFAQSGGFFVTETTGSGQVVVSGFGSMSMLEVEPGKDAVYGRKMTFDMPNKGGRKTSAIYFTRGRLFMFEATVLPANGDYGTPDTGRFVDSVAFVLSRAEAGSTELATPK